MQRYATIADLVLVLPEVSSLDADLVQFVLDGVARLIDLTVFKLRSLHAHVYLTLHHLAMSGSISGGASGPVTSRRVRDLATTYASFTMPIPTELAETRWGRMYLLLERSTPTIGVAVC